MSLQLILGNSGSGKSRYLYEKIIEESLVHPEKNFLVVVPEQFTMQTQKEIVGLHPKHGIMNIDVLSFKRLAYRVFEEVGADRRTVLDDTGKNLLLRRVAMEKQSELVTLKGKLDKLGYITEVKSVISEFTQYDVEEEQLEEMLRFAEERPQLYYKLRDIRVLYEGFRSRLRQQYITAEEVLEVLYEVLDHSSLVKEGIFAFDGFTGFTPIQNKVMKKLLGLSEKVMVSIAMDARENYQSVGKIHRLFYLSKKTVHALIGLAKEAGAEIETPVLLGSGTETMPRFAEAPQLAFLEQNLFRYNKRSYIPAEGEELSVSIHTAANAAEESHFAARTIKDLVRKKGWRYQDMAVIVGDMESYSSYLEKIFEQYQIPCFIDNTKTVLLNPFIEFIRAALEITSRNFSYESMFRCLRTGMCDITSEDVDKLENYVLAAGIKGAKQWKNPFVKTGKHIKEEELAEYENLRIRIMEHLQPFAESIKRRSSAEELTKALYHLITSYAIQEKLLALEEGFTARGEMDKAKEYSQIYGITMELLDKMVELLGSEEMNIREYTQILEAGFEEAKIGIIPPTADRVMVGDIERTRLTDIKALIFLGLNDGWVPKAGGRSGILSDVDRESLAECKVELAPTAREDGYIQRFYLYLNLTKPSRRLYLSYGKSKMDGQAMRPSYLISMVRRMFPSLVVHDEDEYDGFIGRLESPENGMQYLADGLKHLEQFKREPAFEELYSWYFSREDYRAEVEKLVEAAFYTRSEEGLGKAVARALYGSVLENSVTRLEQFAACAYSHFLKYGLGLSEREEYSFEPVDMGNVFHKIIEVFSRKLERSEYTWFDMPDDFRDSLLEECADEVTEEYGSKVLHSSARNEYMIGRMKRIMRRTIWALQEQIRAGRFIPANYEVSFAVVDDLEAVNIALTDDEKMRLRGRIDRVDTCVEEDRIYVKVIDYKSGNTDFDMVALYYGLQLQLVVYLNAAVELEERVHPGKEIIPAGIFYYRMNDPMLDREGGETPEIINEKILKKLRLSGLVNQDPEVVESMDQGMGKDSKVIPVSYNKDGSLSRYSSAADAGQFKKLSGFVNEKMRDLGRRILEGEIEAAPYERRDKTGCDYCPYQEVCGFDKKIPGTRVRRLKEYKPEEIWKRIGEEV